MKKIIKKTRTLFFLLFESFIFPFVPLIVRRYGGFWKFKAYVQANPSNKTLDIIYDLYLLKYASGISVYSTFESPPITPHDISGIFISANAYIGKECVIFHQVTIGSNTLLDSKKSGTPTIGNNCYIGVGAKIIGNVRVGNNCRIGANAVVVNDVPDNAVVVASKANVIIREDTMNNTYKSWSEYIKIKGNETI